MAHFYGDIKGSGATKATRAGSKQSGLEGYVRSYDLGCRVSLSHSPVTGEDELMIEVTRGTQSGTSKSGEDDEVVARKVISSGELFSKVINAMTELEPDPELFS